MQTSQDLLLAKFALKTGLVSQEVLHDCLREQNEGSSKGTRPALIQLLVKRRLVNADGLLPITQAIESTSFDCLRCRVRHPFSSVASTALACPVCGAAVTIVQQDGDQISERLRTGRTQRIKTRADGSARFDRTARVTAVSEPTIKTFGPYEVIAEVGRGGMGIVYKARHPQLDKVVALKVLISGILASKTQVKRFQREAELAGKLRHPAIVAIHDVGAIDDRPYFTMDFVEGTVLEDRLKTRDLPLRQGVEIARDLARALAHAHENGVIHRDVKPANIIIDAEGRPHLTDFGLAREARVEDSARLTRDGAAVGTPYYMSPEQARGEGAKIGPSSDVYSVGVVLFEMLTFERPFTARGQVELTQKILMEPPPRPTELEPAIDRELEGIVLRVLEKDPRDRYPSADAFADDLDRYLRGEKTKGAKKIPRKGGLSVPRTVLIPIVLAGLTGAGFGLWQLHMKQVAAEQEAKLEAQRLLAKKLAEERKKKAKDAIDDAEKAFGEADKILPSAALQPFLDKMRVTIERASDCLQLEPSTPRALLLRARAEELARKKDLAEKDYEKAEELEPKGPSGVEAAYRLACLLLRSKGDESFKSRMTRIAEGKGPELWRHIARAADILQDREPSLDTLMSEVEAAKRIDASCAEVYYINAVALLADARRERVKESLEALEECLRIESKNPSAYALRATIRYRTEQLDEAEEDAKRSLALDPDHIAALKVQAHVEAAKGNFPQSAESMRRILAVLAGHEEIEALVAAVQIFCLADDLSSAERAAARAFELAPEQPEAAIELAQGALRLGHADRGEAVLREALQRCTAPRAQDALSDGMIDLLMSTRQADRAVQFAQSSYEKAPENVTRAMRFASLLGLRGQSGDREKALAVVLSIEQKGIVSSSVYTVHFKLMIDLGQANEIDDTIKKLEKSAGNRSALWIAVARVYASLDRKADSAAAAKKAVDVEPGSADANSFLSQLELSEDRVTEAARHARAALAIDKKNARALVVLARISLRQEGPNPEALRLLDMAISADPGDPLAITTAALMLYDQQKFPEAAQALERFLAAGHGTDSAQVYQLLGAAYAELPSKLDSAEQALRRSLELNRRDSDTHALLGIVLYKKGRNSEAGAEADEALRIDPKNPQALKLKSKLP